MPIDHLEIREIAHSTSESVQSKRSLTNLILNELRFRRAQLDSSNKDFLSILCSQRGGLAQSLHRSVEFVRQE
ncbi:hypothetical protein NEOLEDRAFT_1136770 [Neolentinus lepideus HHB14362 ss-1]|uniref:Uncharacterized protein n=1 Tax=Neolentinus lepideus HHB14362 ss-1 TaxID=1314782 RepID=A0A165R6H2_9AGAM|nr:hypothetical protein NEOLEDRAFT_1136770 [Neolentinus lepideus HHB14362 ss-1]